MRIVVAGAGKMGRYLSKSLGPNHDVVVIESDESRARLMSQEADVRVLSGDVTKSGMMSDPEISSADVFVALTDRDETNLLACFLAKDAGIPRLMARIDDPSLARAFRQLGAEETISPELVAANLVEGFILGNRALGRLVSSRTEGISLMTVRVEKGSKAEGKKVSELEKLGSLTVLGVYENNSLRLTNKDTVLSEGMQVLFIADEKDVETTSFFLR
jgi:trk system potassium uptake protein TrkA